MADPMPRPQTTIRRVLRSKWLWVYLVLLALSHAVRLGSPDADEQIDRAGKRVVEIAAFDRAGEATDGTMRVAYLQWDGDPDRVHPPLILLHGSPGQGDGFERLGSLLAAKGYRVLAPDLPGFGASSHTVASYSFLANAGAMWVWLDGLGVDRVHLVPWSNSGGTALRMIQGRSDRVVSLTLMACVGSQRVEGSGDYFFEHLKYAFGYATLVPLGELIPGVAAIPRWFRISFIRSFWDIDQRPLEPIMRTTRVPTLILHGRRDVLVADFAAHYHHDIMPASRLVMLDATHLFPVVEPELAVPWLVEHFEQTEQPGAITRTDTIDLSRVRTFGSVTRAILWGEDWARWQHWSVQALGIAALAVLVPELSFLLVAFLVADSSIDFGVATLGLFVGVSIRRRRTRPLVTLPLRAIGVFVLVLIHLAVVRLTLGFGLIGLWENFGIIGLIVALVVTAWVWTIARHLWSWRSRQILKGRFGRIVCHEFWPPWVFYAPLVPWLILLAIRHRGAMVFSCINPGIDHGGGITGESKIAILGAMAAAGDAVLEGYLIPAGPDARQRADRVRALMAQRETLRSFPIILKPDSGEKGFAVKLVRAHDDIEPYLASMTRDAILQQYHAGPHEVGVLWVRLPRAGSTLTGRVYSITRKVFPRVVGDGKRSLERLILSDRRLRCQASVFLERWADRLATVPSEGEIMVLSSAGNHAQGTMFCDGIDLLTPQLEAWIDAIASAFVGGLDLGRFDIRYETDEALGRGEGLGIIELNGTLAESTNQYDPAYSIRRTYSVLFDHWAMLYRLGAHRRATGAQPMRFASLVRSVFLHHYARPGSRVAD